MTTQHERDSAPKAARRPRSSTDRLDESLGISRDQLAILTRIADAVELISIADEAPVDLGLLQRQVRMIQLYLGIDADGRVTGAGRGQSAPQDTPGDEQARFWTGGSVVTAPQDGDLGLDLLSALGELRQLVGTVASQSQARETGIREVVNQIWVRVERLLTENEGIEGSLNTICSVLNRSDVAVDVEGVKSDGSKVVTVTTPLENQRYLFPDEQRTVDELQHLRAENARKRAMIQEMDKENSLLRDQVGEMRALADSHRRAYDKACDDVAELKEEVEEVKRRNSRQVTTITEHREALEVASRENQALREQINARRGAKVSEELAKLAYAANLGNEDAKKSLDRLQGKRLITDGPSKRKAMEVECPYCDAEPGSGCVNSEGRTMKRIHAQRWVDSQQDLGHHTDDEEAAGAMGDVHEAKAYRVERVLRHHGEKAVRVTVRALQHGDRTYIPMRAANGTWTVFTFDTTGSTQMSDYDTVFVVQQRAAQTVSRSLSDVLSALADLMIDIQNDLEA